MYVALSGGTLLISVMSQQYNCLMELYTNFYNIFDFSWKFIFPLLLYFGMLGLRWVCMHLWMNLIKRTNDIQEKLKLVKIYVHSQWRVVLLWYHIFWQSSIQRGRHTQLCIITSLKYGLSKSAQTFTVGFVKLLSTHHPIHIVVWGNFPFNINLDQISSSKPLYSASQKTGNP